MDLRCDSDLSKVGTTARKKYLSLLLAPAGVALAVWLVWQLGPGKVLEQLLKGSPKVFAGVLGAYVLQQCLGTAALWLLGTSSSGSGWAHTPVARLARVRFVGEVLNFAFPTGALGGEPYKYLALKDSEGSAPALEALMAAKFLHLAGIGPFAAVVFLAAALGVFAGSPWQPSLLAAAGIAALITLAAWSLVLWQGIGRSLVGVFFRIRRWLPRRFLGIRKLLRVDRSIVSQMTRSRLRTVIAYACYIGMWWAAAFEWFWIAEFIGIGRQKLGLIGGGLFECASIVIGGILPVPAGVGTQEAGKAALAVFLGFSAQTGIAMSLVRRAREMLMVIAGAASGLYSVFPSSRGSSRSEK